MMKKILLLLAVVGVFAAFQAEEKAPPAAPAAPIKIDKLSHWFEGVAFSHATHSGMACADCHHMGFDSGSGCSDCHSKDKTSPDDISLKDAYHKSCSGCHIEKGKGVKEGCENCHKRRILPAPESK